MDGWMEEGTNRQMEGRMDGWMDKQMGTVTYRGGCQPKNKLLESEEKLTFSDIANCNWSQL